MKQRSLQIRNYLNRKKNNLNDFHNLIIRLNFRKTKHYLNTNRHVIPILFGHPVYMQHIQCYNTL